MPTASDPFGTARPCARPGARPGWAASAARFREDANAEEDLVRGGYRDRLLVELAQNAADAAARAGVPGPAAAGARRATTLRAANTGAPLDADGRRRGWPRCGRRPSATRPASVGRFGVGFAAVLAVSDEPAVLSHGRRRAVQRRAHPGRGRRAAGARRRAGAPRGRGAGAPAAVAGRGAAAGGLRHRGRAAAARRARATPSRPPWPSCRPTCCSRCPAWPRSRSSWTGVAPHARPTSGPAPRSGSPTAAGPTSGRSRSAPASCPPRCSPTGRSRSARAAAGRSPGRCRWTTTACRGRCRPGRSCTRRRPSDEPLSLPLRLIAPFPLGPDRRHVAPGPVTDALVAAAADTFADLVTALPADPVLLRAGAPRRAGRGGARRRPRRGRARPAAGHRLAAGRRASRRDRQRPDRAAVLDEATDERVAALADVLPGLLPADWSRRSDTPALAALGVRRVGHRRGGGGGPRGASGRRRGGGGCTRRSTAPTARSSPRCRCRSPTAARRTARPACCCPSRGCRSTRLGPLGLRLAEPGGGRRRRPRGGCSSGSVRGRRPPRPCSPTPPSAAAVEASMDAVEDALDDGAGPGGPGRARCSRSSRPPGRRPASCRGWPSSRCPTPTGGWAPAGELVLPGSALAAVLERRARSASSTRRRPRPRDPDALRAVGVLDTFALVRGERPRRPGRRRRRRGGPTPCSTGCRPDAPPPEWPPLTAVRDLELVRRLAPGAAAARRAPAEAWADVRARRGGRARLPALVAGDAPGARRRASRPAAAPGRHGVTGTVRTGGRRAPRGARPAPPAGDGRRRARRRRRRDRPARPARRPGPHGAAGGAADRLRPAGRGARRHRRRPAGAGARRPGPGGRGRRRPRRAVPAATGRRAASCRPAGRPGAVADLLDLPLASEQVRRLGDRPRAPAAAGRSCPAPGSPRPGSGVDRAGRGGRRARRAHRRRPGR